MGISLASPLRRALFAVACVTMVVVYASWAVRPLIASRSEGSLQRRAIENAIRWEPGNAEHRAQLGRYFMFVAQDAAAAVRQYEAAVALNPYMARYWLDLANACQFTGDVARQRQALDGAMEADPNTPEVAWEAANFYLLQGDVPRALRGLRTVLAADGYRVRPALELCWRVTHNADQVLDLLPREAGSYFKFLSVLASHQESAAADRVWTRMIALGQEVDPKVALPYVQYLLDQHDVAHAQQAWKELAGASPQLRPYLAEQNLIVNGGFTQEILNAGFDWRYRTQPGVAINLDSTEFHSASRALLLAFDGAEIADAGLWQLVPVEPNAEYEFTAFVKSEDLFSASGPQLAIYDAYRGTPLLQMDELMGSRVWQPVKSELQTRGDTRLVAIRVVRSQPATRIRGRLWLDDVSLVRK